MPGTDTLVAWAVRGLLVVLAVIVLGAVVGGVLYGPRLSRALTAAAQGKADTATAQSETTYAQDMGTAQARTQAAEVAVTVQMQESTRETLASPDAGALISPDLYGRFRDGVRRNRAVQSATPANPSPAGADPGP